MLSIVIATTVALSLSPQNVACFEAPPQAYSVPVLTAASIEIGKNPNTPLFRVSSAVLAKDLTLALANTGTNEVLSFGNDGSLKTQLGGTGGGPEEFRQLGMIHPMADNRLAATGTSLQKVVEIDFQTGFVQSFPIRTQSMLQSVFPLQDGRWLAYGLSSTQRLGKTGKFNLVGNITIHGQSGESQQELPITPTIELFSFINPDGSGTSGIPPVVRRPYINVGTTGCIFVTSDNDASLVAYDLTGHVSGETSLRNHVSLEMTQREWDETIDRIVQKGETPAARTRYRQALERFPFDPRRPAFSGMKIDNAGRIWLTPYYNAGKDIDGWWVIAGLEKDPVWVSAPSGTAALLEVRFDHAVLLHQSPLGEETVTLHPIRYREERRDN